MATDSASCVTHPWPGIAAAVDPKLLIPQGKSLLILQLTSIYLERSTIRHLWTRVGVNNAKLDLLSASTSCGHFVVSPTGTPNTGVG